MCITARVKELDAQPDPQLINTVVDITANATHFSKRSSQTDWEEFHKEKRALKEQLKKHYKPKTFNKPQVFSYGG